MAPASYTSPAAAAAHFAADARVADALHRLLVSSVVDYAIYGLTADGRIATWNTGAERLKGYTATEIIGRSVSEFYPPEARNADGVAARALELLSEAAQSGRAEDDGWRVRRDGTRFWANVTVTPVRDEQGTLLGFAKVTRDLTARRAAEAHARELAAEQAARAAAERSEAELRVLTERLQDQALELEAQAIELEAQTEEAQSLAEELEQTNEQLLESAADAEEARDAAEAAQRVAEEAQARYRRLFEASPLPSWTVDIETLRIVDVNEAAVARYGYSREELHGMTLSDLRDASSLPQLHDDVRQIATRGHLSTFVRYRTKQGERLDIELNARAIVQDGRAAFVAVMTDITERLRAETRQRFLVEASELLAESLDYDATLARIVTLAVPTLADWAAYNTLDGDYVRIAAIHHSDPAMERLAHEIESRYPTRADVGAGVAKVIATGVSELIEEIPDDVLRIVAHDEIHYQQLKSVGFHSLINVPLVARGRVLGALGFATGESGRRFTTEDLAFAEELARRAGMALDNALHFRAEQEARAQAEVGIERLGRLQRLAAALSSAVDLDTVSRLVIREIRAAVRADAAYLARRAPREDALELVYGEGLPYDFDGKRHRFPLHMPVPGALVVRTGEPLWLATPEERDAHFGHLQDSPIAREFGSSATMPLLIDGAAVGSLAVYFTVPRAFGPEDRAFLRALAEQVALAVERVRLFEAEQLARRRAEVLQSVTAALAAAQSTPEVARAALGAATQGVGAPAGTLALLSDDRAWFEQVAEIGFPDGALSQWHRFPSDADYPAAAVIATGQPQFLSNREEYVARYPSAGPALQTLGLEATAFLPLTRSGGPAVGYLSLHYGEPHDFPADEMSFLGALAQVTAQAMERARLYEAEKAARAEAEAANRSKSEFLATMSHELRTPLNAIGGYAELIELGIHGPVTGAQVGALARIQRSQKHLLSLINEVLNYARLEAAAVQYDLRDVGVAGILAGVESLILPQVRAKELRLTVGACDPALAVLADAEKLGQVLLNLLSNAVKFTERGGAISITCTTRSVVTPPTPHHEESPSSAPRAARNGAFVEIAVTDTGIGIAHEQLDQIFEPFVQIGRTLNSPGEGTGLGLAISRDLVHGMGGALQVESEPGKGSTFSVTLRRSDSAAKRR